MDRYQRVEKPKAEIPINQNEIRITTLGRMRIFITYATTLLKETGSGEIVLKAMGRAINKTDNCRANQGFCLQRRIPDLHQNTSIGSSDITDMWEPLEEGLLPLETTRHVSMITITLSKKELDVSSIGYQPPLSIDQVKPLNEFEDGETRGRGRSGRGRSRGRGNYGAVGGYNGDGWDSGRGIGGRGQGHGRGNPFRGQGRGYGAGGGSYDYGESDAPPAQGRGRGFGRGRRGRVRGRGRYSRADLPVQANAA